MRIRERPLLRMVRMAGTGQQLAMVQECIDFGEALDFARRYSLENVDGLKLIGMDRPAALTSSPKAASVL